MSTAPNVKDLFFAAVDLSPERALSFLVRACAGRQTVHAEVLELLENRWLQSGSLTPCPAEAGFAPFTGNDRFEVLEALGAGGFGEVYRVRDRIHGVTLALKALRVQSPQVVSGFKNEFRTVRRLSHPNIARIHEIVFDEPSGRWFLTMNHVTGLTLGKFLQSPHPEADLIHLFVGVVRTVADIHAHGILHCDLAPGNIMVESLDRQPLLLDFGLARLKTSDMPITAGTREYLAPELWRGDSPDESTDWYSIGTILSAAIDELPPDENPGLQRLREICSRMTDGARSARPSRIEILQAFGLSDSQAAASVLFGREGPLAQLRSAHYRAQQGSCSVVLVEGASGIGKSYLVNNFLQSLDRSPAGSLIFAGKCYHAESIPWKALDEIVEHLAAWLRARSDAVRTTVCPGPLPALTRLFPALFGITGELPEQSDPSVPDPVEIRLRAVAELRGLFSRIRQTGIVPVVFVDDLQWGDSDSAALLAGVAAAPDAPGMMVIAATRSEPFAVPSVELFKTRLSENAEVISIRLEELGREEARAYALHMTGPKPGALEFAESVASELSRSPFLIGLLARASFSGEMSTASGELPTANSHGVHQVVERQFAEFPESARRLAELLAAAGSPLRFDVLRHAALSDNVVFHATDWLENHSWIRIFGNAGEGCDFYHDALRDSLLRLLDPQILRQRHGELALALKKTDAGPEVIGRHLSSAGQAEEALTYLLIAVERAQAAFAFDHKAGLLREVLSLLPADSAERSRWIGERAAALVNAGRGSDAAEEFIAASRLHVGPEATKLRLRAAAEWLRAGEMVKGKEEFRQLAGAIGLPFPDSVHKAIPRLLFERLRLFVYRATSALPRMGTIAHPELLDAVWAAVCGMQMVDPPLMQVFSCIYLRLALRSGDETHIAVAMATEAVRHAYRDDGICRTARRMLEQAGAYSRRSGNERAAAHLESTRAIIAMLTGRWEQSHVCAGRAMELFRAGTTGTAWEVTSTRTFFFTSRALTGRWNENKSELPAILQEAENRGDRYALTNMRLLTSSYTAQIQSDEPGVAVLTVDRLLQDWPAETFDVQQFYALLAKVDMDLYSGDPSRAWQRFEDRWSNVVRSRLLDLTLLESFGRFARGRAALAKAAVMGISSRRTELLRVVRTEMRQLSRLKASYVPGLVSLLRAGLHATEDDGKAAAEALRSAIGQLHQAQLVPWWAVACLRLSALETGPVSVQLQLNGDAWMKSQGIHGHSEKLVRMLAPGAWQKIASPVA